MRFFAQIAAFAAVAASLASANSLTFINQDDTTRKIVFTPNAGLPTIDSVTVQGNDQVKVEVPNGWIGNAYSVSEGATDSPGMLAEVTFQGWNDLTYFDVSAIVNGNDKDGVKQMYPATQLSALTKTLVSGCRNFPCNSAYYQPDDIQTVSTEETDLIVTLGNTASDVAARDAEPQLVARHYVLGKLSA
ncbi:DNase1 protein [Hypoxylon rubiginosum]|uniref:DNase1 protein n=1 Tax=Hypoxylon rubiginosum TaxID=110542 RepID=A0ACC0CNB6_9PEZI|nr:DNase1 protein [Hypoxylon rubiginosum]